MNWSVIVIMAIVGFVLFDIVILVALWKYTRRKKRVLIELVQKSWQQITAMDDCRLQVLEMDKLVDQVLSRSGYKGNFAVKTKKLAREKRLAVDDLWFIHKKRNQVAHEIDATVSVDESRKIRNMAARFLREMGMGDLK